MSVYVFCQALAQTSTLIKSLQTDARMYTLYATLLPLGNGPFHPSQLDPDELADTLDHLTRTASTLFGAPRAAEQTLEELRRLIEETRDRCPGVELRACFLDKTSEEIYERLSDRLEADREDVLLSMLSDLFSGDKVAMTPAGLEAQIPGLGVVSAARVHQAASVLQALPPEALFDVEEEDWLAEDYGSWRRVYLEAARRDEAIVIG